jgi:hypothetical protein
MLTNCQLFEGRVKQQGLHVQETMPVDRRVLVHVVVHRDLNVVVLVENEVGRRKLPVGLDHVSRLAVGGTQLPCESQLFLDQRSIATGQQ